MRYRFTKSDIIINKAKDGSLVLKVWLNNKWIEHRYLMGYTKTEAINNFQRKFGTYPKDWVPVGTLCLCNHGGLAVMEYEYGINEYGINDYAIVCDNYGDGYKNITKNMIRYDKHGSYFIRYGNKYYLNDFMACRNNNIPKRKLEPGVTYYTDQIYGGCFTYNEMIEDARKNYDYGNPSNYLTYMEDWWKENYKVINM